MAKLWAAAADVREKLLQGVHVVLAPGIYEREDGLELLEELRGLLVNNLDRARGRCEATGGAGGAGKEDEV